VDSIMTGAFVGALTEAFKRLAESFLEANSSMAAVGQAMEEARERMAQLDPSVLSGEVENWFTGGLVSSSSGFPEGFLTAVARWYRCEVCGFETADRTLVLHLVENADQWLCYSCLKRRVACGAKEEEEVKLIPARATRTVKVIRERGDGNGEEEGSEEI